VNFNAPGPVVAANGDVLVFCEARIGKGQDFDPHHIAYKRSSDGGQTWGEFAFLEEARQGQCYMNPVPVLDSQTGRLFLVYALADLSRSTTVFVRRSDDHGRTWSERTDITHLFKDDPLTRTYHLPGPGHGIQHSSGRLIIQMWHRKPIRWDPKAGNSDPFDPPMNRREYGNSIVSSDDGGETWHNSPYLAVHRPDGEPYRMGEARLIELNNGDVLISSRFRTADQPYRLKAISTDRGKSWSEPYYDDEIGSAFPTDAGLIKVDDRHVLLSRPASMDLPRRELTIHMSTDETKTWPYKRVIDPGVAFYSDRAALPNGEVLVVSGSGKHGTGWFGKELSCARLTLDWVRESRE
jgi:Neuraminidase (sialidase)